MEKGQALAKEIGSTSTQVHLEKMDASSLSSMKSFVDRVNQKYPRIDVLINNAAIVPATRQVTPAADGGLELQFVVNILSYFILTFGLSSLLRRSAPARVINVASNLAGDLDVDDLQFTKRPYDKMTAYKQSKQASRELSWAGARFFAGSGVSVYAMHPGVTTSNVLKSLGYEEGWDTAQKCAETAIFLATDEAVGKETGKYYVDSKEAPCQWASEDNKKECQSLWDACKAAVVGDNGGLGESSE